MVFNSRGICVCAKILFEMCVKHNRKRWNSFCIKLDNTQ
jgi:hypothetical protein